MVTDNVEKQLMGTSGKKLFAWTVGVILLLIGVLYADMKDDLSEINTTQSEIKDSLGVINVNVNLIIRDVEDILDKNDEQDVTLKDHGERLVKLENE